MRWRVARKGSMQLSIEAIIILVIAFVLLGLGIVFVKNFFAQASDKTDDIIGNTASACNTATKDNPITPKSFQIKQGTSSTKEICVQNTAAQPINDSKIILGTCIDPDGATVQPATGGASPLITINTAPLPINRGESKAFKAAIKVSNTAALGTYICNVIVKNPDATNGPEVGPIQMTFEVV